jgi:hypothetical protein
MTSPPSVPDAVQKVCAAWLDLIDAGAPGLVTGLHLRGGLGFGEYVEGASDVDMVAVLDHSPSYDEVAALEAAHAELAATHPQPPLDGFHLTAADLAKDPDDCPDLPCALHGWFEPADRYDVTPLGWHELARHSIAVRGELPKVWTDQRRLEDFTRHTLTTEWAEIAASLEKFPQESAADEATWHVLAAARMHHLLVTGEMTSKSAAGRWGLVHYDKRWHPVIREALRIRESASSGEPTSASGAPSQGGAEYSDPAMRGADVAAFTAYVVDQARAS